MLLRNKRSHALNHAAARQRRPRNSHELSLSFNDM
jgi:hypothetical protein